jgi:pimeloyl-ACP methyl ester carboxylesterase
MIIEVLRWSMAQRLALAGIHPVDVALGRGALHAYVGGDGPPVLFIHGALGGALLDWGSCLAGVARRYRVIAPELPGLGESGSVLRPEEMSARRVAEMLAAALLALGVDGPLAVAGMSMGGVIALRLAQLIPERVTRLVLVASTGLQVTAYTPDEVEQYITPPAPDGLQLLMEAIFYHPLRLPAMAVRDIWRSFKPGFAALRPILRGLADGSEALSDEELRAIAIPTALIFAANDQLIPLEHGRRLATLLPHARLTVLPRTGHADLAHRSALATRVVLRGLTCVGLPPEIGG